MATREKKTLINKKPSTPSPQPLKEDAVPQEAADSDQTVPEESPPIPATKCTTPKSTPLVKKLATKNPRQLNKKPNVTIKLKPKVKKKINPKLMKSILKNTKSTDGKKKLLKNGVKQVKPRQSKIVKKDKDDHHDLPPPVLEPIFPINENIDKSPATRKKTGRTTTPRKTKLALAETPEQPKAKRVPKKRKNESIPDNNETLDDVMNDLSSLIKDGDAIKDESDVILSEASKSDLLLKPKRIAKRKRKENIENTLDKFGPAERKVIDMLDLNVQKIKNGQPIATKRRHSIEKFPIGIGNLDNETAGNVSRISIFTNLSRCISPRPKVIAKIRQSGDGRRINPYKTRSDSPARILRNGKHRKLKDLGLLEGLDPIHRKRRRQCADFSGSEVSISKFSGYESDSSFSDLSSLHGGAENHEAKDLESVKADKDDDELNIPLADIEGEPLSAIVKRSLSSEAATSQIVAADNTNTNGVDINRNKEKSAENSPVAVKSEQDSTENIATSPSLKVPDKDLILVSMKQTFNDVFSDEEKRCKEKTCEPLNSVALFGDNSSKEIEYQDETEAHKDEISEDVIRTEIGANDNENGEKNDDIITGCLDDHYKQDDGVRIEETPENLAIKENILQALGLQSLKAAEEAKLKNKEKMFSKNDNYTGTLKTVIKINRDKKKRNPIKMTLQKKGKGIDCDGGSLDDRYKIMKDGEPATNWKLSGQSSDTAGAHRKSHYSNRSNMDGSSEHTSDGEAGSVDDAAKVLVIPEKASSFSIHPGRLCKDECSYCFGKFGLFDTPCHIAQMKSVEKQDKILGAEKHLTRDSCLCDACYRHVDRKSNAPSYINKSYKRSAMVAPGPKQDHCHVLGCTKVASNILRRKWIIKMRKSICQVINIDLDNPGLHSIPVCDEHYSALEHLMVCAMCKRRLARNHVHYLGPETLELNSALNAEGIPLTLTDKPVVCKLCKCFATIILKTPEDRPGNSYNFFMEYKKRLLHFNDIVPMDEAAAEEPIIVPSREKTEKDLVRKRKRLNKNQQLGIDQNGDGISSDLLLHAEHDKSDQNRVPSSDSTSQSRPESPADYMIDYNTLIPSIALECGSDSELKKDPNRKPVSLKKIPRPESVKQAVEISKKLKNDKNSDMAVQRLGSNPSISVRQLFPCEEDLPLQGSIDFGNVKERTPEGWEKCCSIIQYDMETKQLWQELQKPYGNQSSFLRHLILLEKYFRNGDLILSPNASHHSINYSESVHNRLRAYDNIPSNAGNIQPLSMLPFNRAQKSTSGIITSTNINKETIQPAPIPPTINAANLPKSTPITLSQLNSPPLIPTTVPIKPKSVGAPPGLISLQPGTNRPVASLVKAPQSQKIKFPITKNWRPNLIPIDPTKKTTERRYGLVQVISGGKPYHITLEDYKKMCAIKKSFELKQKRLQESKKSCNSMLKSIGGPRKGLVISKTSSSPKNDTSVVESENILEKLDKQVEKLEAKLSETSSKPPLNLPKIPKSLTVIPQTVTRRPSRPSSPVLLITQKPKQIANKS